ncbi:hypothetical protein [Tetragenococcus halophilus]|nr:hypothetical protein [Tetragenococcus halophilus]
MVNSLELGSKALGIHWKNLLLLLHFGGGLIYNSAEVAQSIRNNQ